VYKIKCKQVAILTTIVVIALAMLDHWMRLPKMSDFMRGKQIAHELGCVGCHQSALGMVIMNPSTLRGVIPSFHSGDSATLFWVENKDEFQQWIRQGVSVRIQAERQKFSHQNDAGIKMPVYGERLDQQQLADLYAYFRDSNQFPAPPEGTISRGASLAEQHGCFACHGVHGLDGNSNVGSFKGYIPPWDGEDFHELARSDDEITEWIKNGSLQRLERNPVAKFFLNRQQIKMPAYGAALSGQEISDLIAYIHWLPQRALQVPATLVENPVSDHEHSDSGRGRILFSQSGCTTCHKPSGAEGFLDRSGAEIPSRQRLANRLRVLASMTHEREQQSRWSAAELCSYDNKFALEYDKLHQRIETGIDRNHAGTMQVVMPSWDRRANANPWSSPLQDIDALENFLIADESSITEEMIVNWKQQGSRCALKQQPASTPDHEARRKQILDRINVLDSEGKLFDASTSITFLSKEAALFDFVGFYPDQEIDFWMLRQYAPTLLPSDVQKHLRDADGFPMDKRYVIAVDKTDMDYRAYFFLRDTQQDFHNPPAYITSNRFIDADVSGCFACHASGPRRIRPVKREGLTDLDPQGWELLKRYNQHILGYGSVETIWPANQQKPDAHLLEAAPVESCNSCHGTDAIRAPILRYHRKPVEALLHMKERDDGFVTDSEGEHHLTAMPPVAPAIPADSAIILDWMAR
jgi:cytochrome c551/c552